MSSQLQHKLLHYEEYPPAEVWNRVAASLDEHTGLQLSEKLLDFEETPPLKVWNKISLQLNQQGAPSTMAPFYVRYRKPLKYSGAVAFFTIIAIVVSLLVSKKTESEGASNPPVTVSSDTNGIKNGVTKSLEDGKTKKEDARIVGTTNSISRETNQMLTAAPPSDKYMILNDANGNAIRLSKKLYTAFVCPTNNADCKERMKKLRERFAASAITPDFTGILEILRGLQENQ